MARRCALLLVALLWGSVALGQAVIGTPPFGAYQTVGFGNLDLQNLNVNFTIPVFTKTGRGVNLSLPITYNSLIWYPSGGAWVVVTNKSGSPTWGWQTNYPAGAAWGYMLSNIACKRDNQWYFGTWDHKFWYTDAEGTTHDFGVSVYNGGIDTECGYTDVYESEAYDNSGYLFNFNAPNGPVFDVHGNNVSNVASIQDTNGNYVSEVTNGSTSTYTDTLGDTALTVTVVSSTETDYSYTNPSGGTSTVKLLSSSFRIKTDFGCGGVTDYTGTAVLPTELLFPDGSNYQFSYEQTPGFSGYYTGRIASITLPTGGVISYAYTGNNDGIECSDGSTAALKITTPDGTWSYSRLGGFPTWTTTVTDPSPQQNQTVWNFQGFFPTEEQVYQGSQGSGTLLKTIFTCYNGATPNCNSTAITTPITERAVYTEWPGTSQEESEINTSFLANTALSTEEDDYDYGSGSPGGLIRKIFTTYANLGNNILGDPASVTVQNSSGGTVAQTTYTYDQGSVTGTSAPQHTSVSGSRGNLTTVAYLVTGSTMLSKTFTYYDTGNIDQATDVNGAQTTYTYGACGNSFPTSVSEPLSLSRSMTWNCGGGVETSAADENGQTVSYDYNDPNFWRMTTSKDQENNATNFTYTSNPSSMESSLVFNGNSSTTDALQTLDGLGRSIVTQQRQSPTSSTYDSVETSYDTLGRLSTSTVPYSAVAGQTNGSAPATTTAYDALGRALSTTDGDGGEMQFSYSANDVLVTLGPAPNGENPKKRQYEYNSVGELTSVCEITSAAGSGSCGQNTPATGYLTTYTYDAQGDLTKVSENAQAGSNEVETRNFSYDGLSRMTSETNPESGTTNYYCSAPL